MEQRELKIEIDGKSVVIEIKSKAWNWDFNGLSAVIKKYTDDYAEEPTIAESWEYDFLKEVYIGIGEALIPMADNPEIKTKIDLKVVKEVATMSISGKPPIAMLKLFLKVFEDHLADKPLNSFADFIIQFKEALEAAINNYES